MKIILRLIWMFLIIDVQKPNATNHFVVKLSPMEILLLPLHDVSCLLRPLLFRFSGHGGEAIFKFLLLPSQTPYSLGLGHLTKHLKAHLAWIPSSSRPHQSNLPFAPDEGWRAPEEPAPQLHYSHNFLVGDHLLLHQPKPPGDSQTLSFPELASLPIFSLQQFLDWNPKHWFWSIQKSVWDTHDGVVDYLEYPAAVADTMRKVSLSEDPYPQPRNVSRKHPHHVCQSEDGSGDP